MKRSRVKALGQHFLKNPRILKEIVRIIHPQKSDLIIEVGSGKGALTLPLVTNAGQVIAIEKDKALAAFLQKKDLPNLTVLEADVLKVDFKKLIKKDTWETVKLVGNLPYSISSPLLFRIIGEKDLFSECVFLFQKEFAERICAQPGTKKYAPLSILFQVYFSTRLHFFIPSDSFSPPPRVESALISLQKREKPLFQLEAETFLKFLKKVFQHRRKTLFNNLTRLQYPPPLLREAFQKFGLANSLRPEQLSISQLVSLYHFLVEKPKKVKYS